MDAAGFLSLLIKISYPRPSKYAVIQAGELQCPPKSVMGSLLWMQAHSKSIREIPECAQVTSLPRKWLSPISLTLTPEQLATAFNKAISELILPFIGASTWLAKHKDTQ